MSGSGPDLQPCDPTECRPHAPEPPRKPVEIMIDIETLSLSTHNAAVLSIGAVHFTLNQSGIAVPEAKLWVLDLNAQIAAGREVSAETVKFWQGQSDAARKHWVEATEKSAVIVALDELRNFVPTHDTPIWANGAVFDIGNLESLFKQFMIPVPWRYNAVRDARTIYKATPQQREWKGTVEGPDHHPITDCMKQIWGLWEHRDEADL